MSKSYKWKHTALAFLCLPLLAGGSLEGRAPTYSDRFSLPFFDGGKGKLRIPPARISSTGTSICGYVFMEGKPLPNTMEDLTMFYKQPTPELLDWVNQQQAKAGVWMKKALVALALYDALPKLPMINCPTLALFGNHDMAREWERNLLEGIKGVKHALVPDAGHLPQIDNPQGFTKREGHVGIGIEQRHGDDG